MSGVREDKVRTDVERLREMGTGPARPLDFVFVLRPAVIVPMWIFFAQGARLASLRGGRFTTVLLPSASEWIGLLALTGILGGGYLLNQMVDIETDRLNDKLFFLPRGIISVRTAGIELAVVWLMAIGTAVAVGIPFLWVALGALFFSVTYSAGWIRAKTRVGLDVVWNAAGFGLIGTLAGRAAASSAGASFVSTASSLGGVGWDGGPGSSAALWSIASYTAAVAGVTASTTVLDRIGDEEAGLRTTAVVLGERRTSLLGVALLVLAVGVGAVAGDPVALIGSVVSLALAVRAHANGGRSERISANQLGVGAFVLAASFFSPYVLVLAVVVSLLSRAYYRRRFGFAYPGPGSR